MPQPRQIKKNTIKRRRKRRNITVIKSTTTIKKRRKRKKIKMKRTARTRMMTIMIKLIKTLQKCRLAVLPV